MAAEVARSFVNDSSSDALKVEECDVGPDKVQQLTLLSVPQNIDSDLRVGVKIE